MESKFPNKWFPLFVLLPTLVVCGMFLYYPVAQSFSWSLFRAAFMGLRTMYVGFQNYVRLFTSSDYLHSLWISVVFAGGVVLLGLSFSLAIALLANRKVRGARIYRAALIWPYALSPAAAGTIWLFLFNPTAGVVNYVLERTIGISPDWVTDPHLAVFLVVTAAVWKNLGYNIVFFLAGLQNVPGQVIEAARIDGAGSWRCFWRITLPLLSPTAFFLLIMNIIYAFFNVFGLIDVLTKGGPAGATNILIYNLYRDAFQHNKWGMASAQSVILFIMVVGLTLIQFRTTGRKVHYGG
jgi:sn-glycerol 3-phosphate transport system permease protein